MAAHEKRPRIMSLMVRNVLHKVAFFKACVAIVSIWSDGLCKRNTLQQQALRMN
jgi:hypothetical protein